MILFEADALGIGITATATALTAVALPAGDGNSLRLVNEGPNNFFYALGLTSASTTATLPPAASTTADTSIRTCGCVLAGSDITLRIDPTKHRFFSTICRAGLTATGMIYRSTGQ